MGGEGGIQLLTFFPKFLNAISFQNNPRKLGFVLPNAPKNLGLSDGTHLNFLRSFWSGEKVLQSKAQTFKTNDTFS